MSDRLMRGDNSNIDAYNVGQGRVYCIHVPRDCHAIGLEDNLILGRTDVDGYLRSPSLQNGVQN